MTGSRTGGQYLFLADYMSRAAALWNHGWSTICEMIWKRGSMKGEVKGDKREQTTGGGGSGTGRMDWRITIVHKAK